LRASLLDIMHRLKRQPLVGSRLIASPLNAGPVHQTVSGLGVAE
jgi:hypothetical protein